MSRFYSSVDNSRGTTVTAQGGASGQRSHTRGWTAGVIVDSHPAFDENGKKTDEDELDVYMSTGSNGRGHDVLIGTVRSTSDGPMFTPSDQGDRLAALAVQAKKCAAVTNQPEFFDAVSHLITMAGG